MSMVGSVAYDALRQTTLPTLLITVTVVRDMGHTRCRFECAEMFRRVFHPTDLSECANAVCQMVEQLTSAGTREVFLLHVQDEQVAILLATFDEHDTERLEALCRYLEDAAI